ncbi:Rossmann-fold NAD(P)-binding domain-containing protein [Rhodococcus koreensis]|uniref:hypothetical protein n=1 Tax=Rhodococcus koreensis TaxID=99653 RepID=UPI0036DAD6EB
MNTTIVTEGRGGIGLATARALLRIARSARSSWWTSTLTRPPAFTDRVHLIACDVTDPASAKDARAQSNRRPINEATAPIAGAAHRPVANPAASPAAPMTATFPQCTLLRPLHTLAPQPAEQELVLVAHTVQIGPVDMRESVHQRFEVRAVGRGVPGRFRRPRIEQNEVHQHSSNRSREPKRRGKRRPWAAMASAAAFWVSMSTTSGASQSGRSSRSSATN